MSYPDDMPDADHLVDALLAVAGEQGPPAVVRDLVHVLDWPDIGRAAAEVALRASGRVLDGVYGVPTGGVPVALLVAQRLVVPMVDRPTLSTLVVDDLVDSGRTLAPYYEAGHMVDALYRKPHSPGHLAPHALERTGWLRFPWEKDDGDPVDAVTRLLQFIGEDPNRDGLLNTPARVVKALRELTAGYQVDVAALLSTTFEIDAGPQELVMVKRIPFSSLCEHHMLPFTGFATVGYVPAGGRVVGLSKLARLVHAYGRRLQVQERLTRQIVDALEEHLRPEWAGCVIDGDHSCMSMRGVGTAATMVTVATTDPDHDARSELMFTHRLT